MAAGVALSRRRRRACAHLFEYLDMRPGVAHIAYEPAFAPVVDALIAFAHEVDTPLVTLDVTTVSVSELNAFLASAPKFLCAYNRTFATGLRPYIDVMAGYAVDRAIAAF